MKLINFLLILLAVNTVGCAQQKSDTLFVAHWNVENLFDNIDDDKVIDEEFLSDGTKEWTDERIEKKLYSLSRIIRSMNDNAGPDLLGVCEVEHQYLLDSLVNNYLSDKFYKVSYLESPDGRGIDNGIIYNSKIFTLLYIKGYETKFSDGYDTRLVLLGSFLFEKKDTIHFFVNHWPSRRGGEEESQPRRIKVANTIRKVVDSLLIVNNKSKIVIVGDFNDEPTNISITETLKAQPFFCDSINHDKLSEDVTTNLFNTSYKAWFDGMGSFFYQSDFNMLDQIIISKDLLLGSDIKYVCNSFEVYKPYLMVTRTGKFKGAPFPTYGGARYLGGYSDHFPVTAKFIIEK